MAAKKISEMPVKHGMRKMLDYAKMHGFKVFGNTYRIVKKHQKQKMKEIGSHGRQRISSQQNEYCEILKVSTVRRTGEIIYGYLVGYPTGIRFDSKEQY